MTGAKVGYHHTFVEPLKDQGRDLVPRPVTVLTFKRWTTRSPWSPLRDDRDSAGRGAPTRHADPGQHPGDSRPRRRGRQR